MQGKRRYWLAAWFGPAVLTVLAAVLYFAVFPHRLDLSGSWLAAAYGGEDVYKRQTAYSTIIMIVIKNNFEFCMYKMIAPATAIRVSIIMVSVCLLYTSISRSVYKPILSLQIN